MFDFNVFYTITNICDDYAKQTRGTIKMLP